MDTQHELRTLRQWASVATKLLEQLSENIELRMMSSGDLSRRMKARRDIDALRGELVGLQQILDCHDMPE